VLRQVRHCTRGRGVYGEWACRMLEHIRKRQMMYRNKITYSKKQTKTSP
jgi:hypothetical protein